jgi:hypothetical protein
LHAGAERGIRTANDVPVPYIVGEINNRLILSCTHSETILENGFNGNEISTIITDAELAMPTVVDRPSGNCHRNRGTRTIGGNGSICGISLTREIGTVRI